MPVPRARRAEQPLQDAFFTVPPWLSVDQSGNGLSRAISHQEISFRGEAQVGRAAEPAASVENGPSRT